MKKFLFKFFVIFIVGFISRFSVNYFADINVFADFTDYISLIYYSFFSFFVVFVHELIDLWFNPSLNKIPLGLFDSNLSEKLSSKETKVKTFLAMESNRDNSLDSRYGS